MYCSNKKFAQIAIEQWDNWTDLLDAMSDILLLVKRYGSLVKSQQFRTIITQLDTGMTKLLELLIDTDKLHVSSLQEIIKHLDIDEKKDYHIRSRNASKIGTQIEAKLKDAQIHPQTSETIWLQVAGNGWYYKRTLDRDLDKLLTS